MKYQILTLLVASTLLTACDHRTVQYTQEQPQVVQAAPQVVQAAPAPVIIQQAAPAHSGGDMLTGALLGGMAGHMIGSAGRDSHSHYAPPAPVVHKTVVVNKTVVQKNVTVVNRPAYRAPARSSYTRTTVSLTKRR